ncbi:phage-shock protein [Intestinimonas sp.]|uniref:phage-shock protein n=1 Tax=Intestinimonas sp. TaxID=1965293 RepID=UPI00261D3D37|nr:phage-shock protein [Intestinimonas sp.]
MFTLFALTLVCLVGVVLFSVAAALVLTLIGLPLALLFSLLPWVLRLAGIVLLVKGLLDRPFQLENLLPAAGAFAASWLLSWLF